MFSCETCAKTFTRHADLERHKRSVHEGQIFKCAYCSFTCNRKDNLKKHDQKHNTGLYPKLITNGIIPDRTTSFQQGSSQSPLKMKPTESKAKHITPITQIPFQSPESTFIFKHPFTMLVAGPTGCGKTYFVKQMLESDKIQPRPDRIIYMYGLWQPLYEEMRKTIPNIHFIQG